MEKLLKFSALTVILALVAFGCAQDQDVNTVGPTSDIQNTILNGDETLGPPVGLVLASGTGYVTAGQGLFPNLDGSIDFTVPAGVTVKQVILYWEGQHSTPAGDADITVNSTAITGDFIGGGTGAGLFYSPYYSSTYRADITGYGWVAPGPNSLMIEDMDFVDKNSGAGVLVIYEEMGEPTAYLDLVDGNDQAWIGFAPPKDACVEQTFNFAASTVARQAMVAFFFGSIEDQRPDILRWEIDGVPQPDVCDAFSMPNDGDEWAEVVVPLTIPAGATSLTFEPVSDVCVTSPYYPGGNPQSFVWVACALSIEGEPPMGEGCTPGYWKNARMHGCNWAIAGYSPTDDFDTEFGVDIFNPDMTLMEALNAGGGGWYALGRHAVAALLDAAHPDVDYGMTVAEVIAWVQAAYASGDPGPYKDQLEMYNEMGCPLANCK